MKKKIEKSTKKDEVLIVLEQMRGEIGIISEGQQLLRGEINRRFDETNEELHNFKNETRSNFATLFKFRDETRADLKIALEYLSRIDDEISDIKNEIREMKKRGKVDDGWVALIEKRIEIIEKQLKFQKQAA